MAMLASLICLLLIFLFIFVDCESHHLSSKDQWEHGIQSRPIQSDYLSARPEIPLRLGFPVLFNRIGCGHGSDVFAENEILGSVIHNF
jgi:hypothetical protein